jgi:hypothetical protein
MGLGGQAHPRPVVRFSCSTPDSGEINVCSKLSCEACSIFVRIRFAARGRRSAALQAVEASFGERSEPRRGLSLSQRRIHPLRTGAGPCVRGAIHRSSSTVRHPPDSDPPIWIHRSPSTVPHRPIPIDRSPRPVSIDRSPSIDPHQPIPIHRSRSTIPHPHPIPIRRSPSTDPYPPIPSAVRRSDFHPVPSIIPRNTETLPGSRRVDAFRGSWRPWIEPVLAELRPGHRLPRRQRKSRRPRWR